MPPVPKGHSRALDPDIAQRLEQVAWARRDAAGVSVLLGLYAGLRRFEIAGLRWDSIEFDKGFMTVRGKGSLEATVPIHPHLVVALRQLGPPLHGYVFPGRKAGHVSPATVWSWVRQVATEGGLGLIETHELRHTMLTEANDRSGDLRTVRRIARHSRPETTALYTRVSTAQMVTVVGQVDYGRPAGDRAVALDPADGLPGVGYRQLVTLIEGEDRTAVVEAWVELGVAAAAAGWEFHVDEHTTLSWASPTDPRLRGFADGCGDYSLIRVHLDEHHAPSEHWSVTSPAELLTVAATVAAGRHVPCDFIDGPWTPALLADYQPTFADTPPLAVVPDPAETPAAAASATVAR